MKKVTLFIASVAALMYFTSCGSAPVTEDSGVEAPVIQEDVETQQNVQAEEESDVTDRDGILAKIEDARKAALEAGADKKAPQLLEALDTIYEKVKADVKWHMIGHLQSNKVKYIAPFITPDGDEVYCKITVMRDNEGRDTSHGANLCDIQIIKKII